MICHSYIIIIDYSCLQRATKVVEEMEAAGVKPNVRTYTTLIKGWARASLPEKAFRCFEEMKQAGLKPDKPAYHCLMTSLLSRATITEDYIYSGIVSICKEMIENDLTVDLRTAVHWSKCLQRIERSGGELTEAIQRTFPPAWNTHEIDEKNSDYLIESRGGDDSEYEFSDESGNEDNDDDAGDEVAIQRHKI